MVLVCERVAGLGVLLGGAEREYISICTMLEYRLTLLQLNCPNSSLLSGWLKDYVSSRMRVKKNGSAVDSWDHHEVVAIHKLQDDRWQRSIKLGCLKGKGIYMREA